MTTLEAVRNVIAEYFNGLKKEGTISEFSIDGIGYDWLAKEVIKAYENVELDEHNAYEERYLLGLRDSQASAFQEDLNERKARQ